VLDIEALDRNIAAMATFAAAKAGLRLRPHAKTHKSVDIARRQIAAGALGVCCAKLGEAEALADGGIEGMLITSPIVGERAVERLVALAARSPRLMHSCDHPDAVDARSAQRRRRQCATLTLLVDLDPGLHRTGVAERAETLWRWPARSRGGEPCNSAGCSSTAAPSSTSRPTPTEREGRHHRQRTAKLTETIAALNGGRARPADRHRRRHRQPRHRRRTGRAHRAAGRILRLHGPAVQRLRPARRMHPAPFETSLTIDARVISASHPFMVTIDAGLKAFATERSTAARAWPGSAAACGGAC
jgi:3-hydroxy-D-aspartate aldolase